jgi:hypothetical protein
MNVKRILLKEHEPLIFHLLRNEAQGDPFIFLLGKLGL